VFQKTNNMESKGGKYKMNRKDIALNYLKQGLSVIPLFSPEMIKKNPPKRYAEALIKRLEENTKLTNPLPEAQLIQEAFIRQCKTPIVPWTPFQTRHPTEQEVCEWFEQNPAANIGIVTGRTGRISNLVVFDLDSENAVDYANARGGFSDTPKVRTGKGYHIYMRHPGFEVRNRVNQGLKIDIRADGGYVAAPPSVHGSGRTYEWVEGFSIFEINPAPCEQWMIDYLQDVAEGDKPEPKTKSFLKQRERLPAERSDKPKGEYAEILKKGAAEGNRNDTATRLAGHLLAKGVPENEAWEILTNWNHKNRPPLDLDELKRTFESVCKLESRNAKDTAIDSVRYLDTLESIVSVREESFVQIPFAGDNLASLQNKMGGGLLGGRLYILGGIPSASKTMLANNMADNICLSGYPVLFFSYDDGRDELRKRTLSRFSGIQIEQFNRNRVDKAEMERICRMPQVAEILLKKYVVEDISKLNRWDGIIEQVSEREKKAPVIIIDYLRKLRTERHIGDERLRVDEILGRLREIANRYNTPVLVVSELARDSYKSGQRLSMASFKESGSIEYDASWLGILAAVEEDETGEFNLMNNWERIIADTGNVDLIVLKAKRGAGLRGRVPLKADRDYMIIRDREVRVSVSKKRQGRASKFAGGRV
jgi:replicative DNA helicase